MGFKKLIGFLILIVFFSGCILLTKKNAGTAANVSNYPPLPKIFKDRKLVIMPFENDSGKLEYNFITESLPGLLYNYLKFVTTIPFQVKYAVLDNEKEYLDYFGAKEKFTPAEREKYLSFALQLNAERISSTSSSSSDMSGSSASSINFFSSLTSVSSSSSSAPLTGTSSTYSTIAASSATSNPYFDINPASIPSHYQVKVLPPARNIQKYLNEKVLFLKGKLNKDMKLIMSVYDPLIDEELYSFDIMLPPINESFISEDKDIQDLISASIKPLLEQISGQSFFKFSVQTLPEDAIAYVDENFLETGSALLTEGYHRIKVVRTGFETYEGEFNLKKNENILLELKEVVKKTAVTIETDPAVSTVFVDSKYIGLSPVELELSEGLHQIRVSRSGYDHYNQVLKIFPGERQKNVKITLMTEKDDLDAYRKRINTIKNVAFYLFFPSMAGWFYTQAQFDYYYQKLRAIEPEEYWGKENLLDQATQETYAAARVRYGFYDLGRKYNFYQTAYQFFRGATFATLATAAVFLILELEIDDIGVGVDQDKNIGVFIKY